MEATGAGQMPKGLVALTLLIGLGMAVPLAAPRQAVPDTRTVTELIQPIPGSMDPASTRTLDGESVMGLDFIPTVVTGYSSTPDQTDDTPWLTAWCTQTRPGIIALSRDLLRTFTEGAPFDFGDRVLVAGVGVFLVEDTMATRWKNRADIWFPTRSEARQWGRREALLALVREGSRTDLMVAKGLSSISEFPVD